MKNKQIELLDREQFRRLTGVKRDTFEKMLIILKESDIARKSNRRVPRDSYILRRSQRGKLC